MSDYEIGRDLQELRSRVECLEASLGGRHGPSSMRGMGRVEGHRIPAGIDPKMKPLIWKPGKDVHVPPFFNARLGLSPRLKLDSAQSTTWTCSPEPLIQFVNWNDGSSEECYRLQNQSFTIYRATNPNSGITTCSASYDATLIASGKAKETFFAGSLYFNITLVNDKGGSLKNLPTSGYYTVDCHDNYPFSAGSDFDPGLYDLVAGATWNISGYEALDRC